MRNYYYTAWESKEDRRDWNQKPSIQGWVQAKNMDDAERIIASHGFVRDTLTPYTKAEREAARWGGDLVMTLI